MTQLVPSEAAVGHFETVMANMGEVLARHETDRTSDRLAIGERLAAIESAILRFDEQATQSSRVERYLNDKLDRLASQLEERRQSQPRSRAITADEAAQPTEQGSIERHRSENEETNSPDTKPSAAGKKHKQSKARKNHKR